LRHSRSLEPHGTASRKAQYEIDRVREGNARHASGKDRLFIADGLCKGAKEALRRVRYLHRQRAGKSKHFGPRSAAAVPTEFRHQRRQTHRCRIGQQRVLYRRPG